MQAKDFFKTAIAATVLFVSSTAVAQQQMQGRSPEQRAQKQMEWMQANLALTPDQTQKTHDILMKYAAAAEDAKANGQRGAGREIQADKDADLKRVLTGDQYQLYQAHMQQMKEKMMQRRQGEGGQQQGMQQGQPLQGYN